MKPSYRTLSEEIKETIEMVWNAYKQEHMTTRMIGLRGTRLNLAMCLKDLASGIQEETVRARYEIIKHALSRF